MLEKNFLLIFGKKKTNTRLTVSTSSYEGRSLFRALLNTNTEVNIRHIHLSFSLEETAHDFLTNNEQTQSIVFYSTKQPSIHRERDTERKQSYSPSHETDSS